MRMRCLILSLIFCSILGSKAYSQIEEYDTIFHCSSVPLEYNITFVYSEIEAFEPEDIIISFENNRYTLRVDSTLDFVIEYTLRGVLYHRNIHVVVPELSEFSFETDKELDQLCPGTSFTIVASPMSFPQGDEIMYSWRALNATIIGETNSDSCEILFDRENVSVEFTAFIGSCSVTDTLSYQLDAVIPELTIRDTVLCPNTRLEMSILNPEQFESYSWSSRNYNLPCPNCDTIEIAFDISDTITFMANLESCTFERDFIIQIEDIIRVPDPDTICAGMEVILIPNNVEIFDQIAWSNNGVNCQDESCQAYTFASNQDVDLIVEALSKRGCLSSDIVEYRVKAPLPDPSFNSEEYATCNGEAVRVTINNTFQYDSIAWTPDSSLSCLDCYDPIINTNASRFFQFTLYSEGCIKTDSVEVIEEFEAPVVFQTEVCEGQDVRIDIEDPQRYMRITWQGISEMDTCAFLNCSSQSFVVAQDTSVVVQLLTESGCLLQQTYDYVIHKSSIQISSSNSDSIIPVGESVELSLTGDSIEQLENIVWLNNGEIICEGVTSCSIIIDQSENLITAEGVYSDTCRSIFNDSVFFIGEFDSEDILRMPNVFTPDHSINNIFRPIFRTDVELVDFKIYDRYGRLVFQSSASSNGWDGTTKGKNAPQGIYTYNLSFRDSLNNLNSHRGEVTLYR